MEKVQPTSSKNYPMYTLNRSIAILRKKQPYLNWVQNLPDPDHEISLKELNREPDCFLIPNFETDESHMNYVKKNCAFIFEEEMNSWWTDEKDWEKDLSWKNFQKWFDIEICSLPFDLVDKEIIRDEC